MNLELPNDIIHTECNLFYNNKTTKLQIESLDKKDWEEEVKKLCSEHETGLLSIGFECLYEDKMFHILELIKKYNPNYKLHSSTISSTDFTTNPYTNIATLHATQFVYDIEILNQDYNIYQEKTILNVKNSYDLSKHLFLFKSHNKKTIPYVLSARRWNVMRFQIFTNLKITNPSGIIRFVQNDNPYHDTSTYKNYINTSELMVEYDKSYISFVLETCVDNERTMGYFIPLTEKTLIAFHTKTLPIIFGCKGLNKKLNQLGFWTANEFFGFNDETNDIEEFNNLVRKIDNLSIQEINKIYNDNINNIENNFNLLNEIFNFGRKINKEYLIS